MTEVTPPAFDGHRALHSPKISFEFFPPKTEEMERSLWDTIKRLAPLSPNFVSVTYGAGGSTRERTHSTITRILNETNLLPAAHLTCVGAARGDFGRQPDEVGHVHPARATIQGPRFVAGFVQPLDPGFAGADAGRAGGGKTTRSGLQYEKPSEHRPREPRDVIIGELELVDPFEEGGRQLTVKCEREIGSGGPDDFARGVDQTAAQQSRFRWLATLRFPPGLLKTGSQNRARIFLELLPLRLAGQEPVDEIEHVHDLLAFGQFIFRGQFFDQVEIERERRAVRLHQRPGIVHYLFDYSRDMEYLEIVGPADFTTVDVEKGPAEIPPPTPWK